MREELAKAEVEIARVAARQHGVITVEQLRGLGVGRSGVTRRLKAGRLHRLHRGVYAVGHAAPGRERAFMAAVLACGPGAALSHASAAVHWEFLKPLGGPVHVTVPGTAGRARRQGIVLHRSPSLCESEESGAGRIATRDRIPLTTPRRTIEDLPATLPAHLVRRARRQAEFLRFELRLPTSRTRSDLEDDFLAFCRRHRLPPPEVNPQVGRHRVDFLWRAAAVVVETDFFAYHRGHQSFEDDHRRDLELRRLGLTVLRYTGAQLEAHPAEIAAELRALLGWGRA